MAARHLVQTGRSILRPATWGVTTAVYQRSVTMMMTSQNISVLGSDLQRFPQLSIPSAYFHSSGHLFDENNFIIQDEDDFKEKVLTSDSVVIVDFHAEWCNPCKALAPVLDVVLKNTQGQIKLAKVDIDELQDLAIGYGVDSVPTVMAFKGGQKVAKFIGLQSQDKVEEFVEKLLT